MKGIHDVFPEDVDDEADSISLKKLKKQEAQWNSKSVVLDFVGGTPTLAQERGFG